MTAAARPGEAGFAIILALWAVGVVGLVGMGYVAGARARVTATGAIAEQARVAEFAEGAAMSAAAGLAAELLAGRFGAARRPLDGTPVACSPAPGIAASVVVEDEGGKVNLSLAPPALLAAALAAAGASEDTAQAILAGVLAARGRAAAAPPPERPQAGEARRREERRSATGLRAFASAYEAGAFVPSDERLLSALMPLVTAHSNRPGIDPQVASPRLLAGLGAAGREPGDLPAAWVSPSERQAFTIRVTAASARALARVDVVAVLDRPPGPALRFVEWRRDPAPVAAAGWPDPASLPPC